MKKIATFIAAGLIPVVILFLFMKFISLNLSYSILVGMVSLLFVSFWQSKNRWNPILKSLLLAGPLLAVFYLLIVREIPGLWIALPLFVLAAGVGTALSSRKSWLFAGLGLLVLTGIITFAYLPKIIADNLGEALNEAAPPYEIRNLKGGGIFTPETNGGKVVVLDFFGTWCAPCIAEMKDLKEVEEALSDRRDEIDFIIVCTDTAGDTPEKAEKFHTQRQPTFLLGYDENSVVHKSFGFTGVPGLIVMDKQGMVRYKHEGYNQAEDLQGILLPLLNELLNE